MFKRSEELCLGIIFPCNRGLRAKEWARISHREKILGLT